MTEQAHQTEPRPPSTHWVHCAAQKKKNPEAHSCQLNILPTWQEAWMVTIMNTSLLGTLTLALPPSEGNASPSAEDSLVEILYIFQSSSQISPPPWSHTWFPKMEKDWALTDNLSTLAPQQNHLGNWFKCCSFIQPSLASKPQAFSSLLIIIRAFKTPNPVSAVSATMKLMPIQHPTALHLVH